MNATVANHRRRIWQFMFDESLSLDSTISRGRYGIDQFASPFHRATDSATKRTEVKDCKGSGAARGTTPPAYLSFSHGEDCSTFPAHRGQRTERLRDPNRPKAPTWCFESPRPRLAGAPRSPEVGLPTLSSLLAQYFDAQEKAASRVQSPEAHPAPSDNPRDNQTGPR
jgi:hypothetical protein